MLSTTPVATLSDEGLLAELAECAALRRQVDARSAAIAGEIRVRSDRELGYSGLAQGKGARTTEVLVQQITGLSKAEAAAVVGAGSRPDFLDAVKPEELGVSKVDAVRRGLGEVTPAVSESDLRSAAERLVQDAPHLTVEGVAARARAARDELDATNVADRTRAQRDERYLRLTPRMDGMTWINGLLDPESAMVIKAATDAIIAPRRGGPRFVDKEKAAEQERAAIEDDRSVPQMMVDALVDLVSVAVATDDGAVLTGNKGHVTLHAVQREDGTITDGYFEGHLDALPKEIIERALCDGTENVVGFEHGNPVDSSSDQRLFNRKQRRALAARWGGCAIPDCDRPPSWTEAHHIRHWSSGHHKTEVVDGVLLCRHHHMLLHNNRWRVERRGNDYLLFARDGTVTVLESKSPLFRSHRGGVRVA